MRSRIRWLTRANGLTGLRLLAAPALVVAVTSGADGAAAALFGLAVLSDLGDGWLARRHGEATPLGQLVDHAADATFVTLGTAALASEGALPLALPPLIAAAFLQYAVDSRALRASALGRWNGIAYYAAVGVPIVRDALGLAWPAAAWVRLGGWLLVATTLVSIADRLRLLLRQRAVPDRPPPIRSESMEPSSGVRRRRARGWRGAGRGGRWRR